MILTDTGPLISLIDRDEPDHERCVECLSEHTAPMLTTSPVFTEAVYLLGDAGGWEAQKWLWSMFERKALLIAPLDRSDWERSGELMEEYQDRPMDLADATLMVLADRDDLRQIFSLDSDFYVYRKQDGTNLTVIP